MTIPSWHLDGDFTDFISNGRNTVDALIGDVMGKAISAALVASGVKSHLLKVLAQHDCSISPKLTCPFHEIDKNQLGEVVSFLHARAVPELLELEMFATICYARFNQLQKKVAYVGCGHLPIIHYQAAKDRCLLLPGDNLPLGLAEVAEYRTRIVDYLAGDLFVFCSDGITEAKGESSLVSNGSVRSSAGTICRRRIC